MRSQVHAPWWLIICGAVSMQYNSQNTTLGSTHDQWVNSTFPDSKYTSLSPLLGQIVCLIPVSLYTMMYHGKHTHISLYYHVSWYLILHIELNIPDLLVCSTPSSIRSVPSPAMSWVTATTPSFIVLKLGVILAKKLVINIYHIS